MGFRYSAGSGGGGGGGAVTIADGADVALGAVADAAVSTDAAGTVNAHLRGLVKLLAAGITATVSGTVTASGQIAASSETSTIYNGGSTALTPKFKAITASSSGATTIVALVAAKKIRVVSWSLVCNAAVNVKWQSHVTPTDLTGLYYFAANGGISVPFSPVGYFETIAGEALDINLSGAQAVGGVLCYVEV